MNLTDTAFVPEPGTMATYSLGFGYDRWGCVVARTRRNGAEVDCLPLDAFDGYVHEATYVEPMAPEMLASHLDRVEPWTFTLRHKGRLAGRWVRKGSASGVLHIGAAQTHLNPEV